MEMEWDLLIIDESHFLKSEYAKRTQAILGPGRNGGLISKAKKVVALTGTPLPNRPRECFTIARALCHEAIDWVSFDEFSYRYNPAGYVGAFHVVETKGRLPELQARLRCNFMIRRLKKEVLQDLPEKTYEFTYVEPNGAIKRALAKEKMIDFDVADLTDPFADIWGQIATVRREMGEAKVPRVIEHIKYLLDIVELEKVVIFSHHRSVMDGIRDGLSEYGVAEVRGGLSPKRKQESVDSFVENPETRIWSGQLDAAGFGIDGLQKVCSHAVIAEPAWTEGTNEQCIARLDRYLQKFSVLAQFVIVEGSFDERVLGAVLPKAKTTHATLDKRF
jgi:SWI/SNF-related matrix-associated actin-dependent regulator 1 of chromatin subfamily A